MKNIITTLLLALAISVSAQERTSALKDLSNVTAEDMATAINAAIAEDPAATWQSLIASGGAVVADASGTDTDRGTALVAAYTAAKALTPNGSALSATNRAKVILPPGGYRLTSTLDLDGEFVDLVALFPEAGGDIKATDVEIAPESGGTSLTYYRPPGTVIYMDTATQQNVVEQSAADVRLYGFGIAHLGDPSLWDVFGEPTAAFMVMDVNNAPSKYTLMYFWSKASNYEVLGACRSYWSFRGTWDRCIASGCSFRVGYGDRSNFPAEVVFEANMTDCQGGPYSFIGDAYPGETYVAKNSTILRCKTIGTTYEIDSNPLSTVSGFAGFSGCTAIGLEVESTVTFVDCDAGPNSYSVGNMTEATYIRCRGKANCFGGTAVGAYEGNFAGYAEDCFAGANSFGGSAVSAKGKLTGTLVRCTGTGNANSIRCEGATIRDSRITTTTTGIHALTLLDSNTVVSNSDIIVLQGGTGLPIYAASASNVAAYDLRMNNASNDADGLGANVTNLVSSAGNIISDSVE